LTELKTISSPVVRDVRGLGLMVGVETKSNAGPHLAGLAENGVLALSAGSNVLRFLPPLVIDHDDLNTVIAQVSVVLQSV
jgi:acetylornithine/LysW-gamma-L-lysine aminotransferase